MWFDKIAEAFRDWNDLQWQRLFVFDHALSFFSIVSNFLIVLLLLFFWRLPWRRVARRVRAHLGARRVRREFVLDLKFFALRWLHFPLSMALIGGAAVFSHSEVADQVYALIAPWLPWVRMEFDEIRGPAVLLFYTALVLDFSAYLSHRISHSVPWFWHFHKVHHRARYLNPLTKYRIHPLSEVIESSTQALVVGVLMAGFNLVFFIPDVAPVLAGTGVFFLTHWLTLHLNHSHVRLSFGPLLERVFLSPVLHQVHHGRDAKYHDKNFGTALSFWDRIFGTFYSPGKNEKWAIGLDEDYDPEALSLHSELVKPFVEVAQSVQLGSRDRVALPSGLDSKTRPSRQAGYSLTELIIAVGVSAMLVLIGSVVLLGSIRSDFQMSRKIDAAAEFEQGLKLISRFAQLGLEVRPSSVSSSVNLPPSMSGEGYIRRNFAFNRFADMGPRDIVLMYFSRENRVLPKTSSSLSPASATAVFFRRPTPDQMGSIHIDSGSGVGTEVLALDDTDFQIGNVVGVSLQNARVNGATNLVERIELSVIVRHFLVSGGEQSFTRRWCPPADLNQCPGLSQFKDLTRRIVLDFANNRRINVATSSRPAFEFPHGFYLFRSQVLRGP